MKKCRRILIILLAITFYSCDKDDKCDVTGVWYIVTEYTNDNGTVFINPLGIIGESEALTHYNNIMNTNQIIADEYALSFGDTVNITDDCMKIEWGGLKNEVIEKGGDFMLYKLGNINAYTIRVRK